MDELEFATVFIIAMPGLNNAGLVRQELNVTFRIKLHVDNRLKHDSWELSCVAAGEALLVNNSAEADDECRLELAFSMPKKDSRPLNAFMVLKDEVNG